VPFMGIIGDRELESRRSKIEDGKISVRTREGKDLGQMSLTKFTQKVQEKIEKKLP